MNDQARNSKQLRRTGSVDRFLRFGFGNSLLITPLALGISNEFFHGLTARIHEILRATAEVRNRHFAHVNAEVVIERGEDVAELDRPVRSFAPEPIRRANHLPGLHAAAGQQPA